MREALVGHLKEEDTSALHLLAFFDPADAGQTYPSWHNKGPIVAKRKVQEVHVSVKEWYLSLVKPDEARDPVRMRITTWPHILRTGTIN